MQRSRRALLLLSLVTIWPARSAAQQLPVRRFDPSVEWQARTSTARSAMPSPGGSSLAGRRDEAASASRLGDAQSRRWRDNGGTVLIGSVLGAAAGMAAGGALGAVVGAPTGSGCGDYPCWFVLGIYGAVIVEPFGAGYGGYLGGRRRGLVVLDMLAATGVAAAGLVPMVRGDVHPAVVPAAQLLSIVLVDRAVAAVRARGSRGSESQDPFR